MICEHRVSIFRILIGASLLATAAIALCTYPDHIASFNKLAGGPANSHPHLLQSNLAWGQGKDAGDGPPQKVNENRIGTEEALLAGLPSLADARDSSDLTISTVIHVLLLHGLRETETGLTTPASGREALQLLTHERVATAAFGQSPFVRTRNGLRYRLDGAVLTEGVGIGESHRDQCLATFATLALPLSHPITLDAEKCTIQDLVSESIANFSLDQRELAWTAIAYAHYLRPARQWTDRFGRRTTFSELLQHLIDRGYVGRSCGGMHVLQAIAAIIEADYQSGVLNQEPRLAGHNFLQTSVKRALLSQRKDGSWDLRWHHLDASESPLNTASFESKVVVTGHMLELMHGLRKPPPHRVIVRATLWLIQALQKSLANSDRLGTCPLTHALHGIRLSYNNQSLHHELAQVFATAPSFAVPEERRRKKECQLH